MASFRSVLSEDQLLCCICLDVFTEPVSTPCGHNFCKKCLAGYWNSNNSWICPLCNKSFENRPDLSVNTFISETAAQFRKSVKLASRGSDRTPSKLTEVPCDACPGVKEKSVKLCLNCRAYYCETHLEPHKYIQILKKHKLIDPVENLEGYICQKHERPLELFCRDDQMCVCLFCTVTDHKTHNTVPLEEAKDELKANLWKTQAEVQSMIQDRLKKSEEIKHSLELWKKSTESESASGVEVFTALIHSIERSQLTLLEVMEEKQKAAEKQAEDFIKDLEQEITELKKRDTELEQLSHTEDHLHLLKIYPSLCRPPVTNNVTHISFASHPSVEIVKTNLSQLQKTLNDKMDKEIKKLDQRSQHNTAVITWQMIQPILLLIPLLAILFLVSNKMWIQLYTVDVTLDPDTANCRLILSNDGKHVRDSGIRHNVPYLQKRFQFDPYVLGKEGFSSGKFYFEVQVSGKTDWDVGVARESTEKSWNIYPKARAKTWTVILRNGNKYEACVGSCTQLSLRDKLEKVGVFVDYEEGLVSFYDVETRSPIYSFTAQSFTEKLYPFFCPGFVSGKNNNINSAPLIISSENRFLTILRPLLNIL